MGSTLMGIALMGSTLMGIAGNEDNGCHGDAKDATEVAYDWKNSFVTRGKEIHVHSHI